MQMIVEYFCRKVYFASHRLTANGDREEAEWGQLGIIIYLIVTSPYSQAFIYIYYYVIYSVCS